MPKYLFEILPLICSNIHLEPELVDHTDVPFLISEKLAYCFPGVVPFHNSTKNGQGFRFLGLAM